MTAPVIEPSLITEYVLKELPLKVRALTELLPVPPKKPVPTILMVTFEVFKPVEVESEVKVGAGVVTTYSFPKEASFWTPFEVRIKL